MDRLGCQAGVRVRGKPRAQDACRLARAFARARKSLPPKPPRKAANQTPFRPYRTPTPVGREKPPEVNETTSVKELGKLTPYLWKKGCPSSGCRKTRARGPQETGSSDCLPKTQVSANAKADI